MFQYLRYRVQKVTDLVQFCNSGSDGGRWVIKSDCGWEEWLPVSFLRAAGLNECPESEESCKLMSQTQ